MTAGEATVTIHRLISSGSSFGADPLRQTIGPGKEVRVARLEVEWPTSGTTRVFCDIDPDRAIEITELDAGYRSADVAPIRNAPVSRWRSRGRAAAASNSVGCKGPPCVQPPIARIATQKASAHRLIG